MERSVVPSSDVPPEPQPGTPDYARLVSIRNEIVSINHEIAVLQAKAEASRKSLHALNSFTCLAGYHQESSKIMMGINLIITLFVGVGSVLTRTEEAAMISLFAYMPVIVIALLQMRVSIMINSRAHIALLQYYAIASFMFAGIALMLRIYALAANRHHGLHVLDIIVLVCQVCEMIISIVILVGADQEGFALGQISSTVARLHHAELVQSDVHQRHADSLATRTVLSRTRSLIWTCITTPVRAIWHWRMQPNAHPKTD